MSRNILTELKNLVGNNAAKDRIVEVISFDPLTKAVTYKSRAGTSSFISDQQYAPGDSLIMNGDNVIGLSEPLTNTVWID